MATLASRILERVAQTPGMTDRELANELRGRGVSQQPINQEARILAGRGKLIRKKRPDGLIGNYVGDGVLINESSRSRQKKKLPALADFQHASELIAAVASYVRLPHPNVVAAFGGPVFSSIRDKKNRVTLSEHGDFKLLLDDNTTPRWAMLWSHGYGITAHPKGWTFAHVWARPRDRDCYTHLANLAMMPEYLASLSDKDGPLSLYLRYHSWEKYGWKPRDASTPQKPHDYESVSWAYLQEEADPQGFIKTRINELDNKRCRLLCSIR